ncbi:D-alanyl-D-alanine carboxypeptidase/D-alanyl-D-alanine-endopeptidase [Xylophilus sp. Kf1]|nr:D-alanyl-D-alanine carboxypeptidase/D-alanyl-D-alanine-endopeptidase [Xylophilus sp. Kf1]
MSAVSAVSALRAACIAFATLGFVGPGVQAQPVAAVAATQARLPAEVEAALQRARLPADALSVVVAPAGGGTPLVRWRADQSVNPASVMKLVTTYAGLDLLGPTYRWTTPVTLGGPVDVDGTLQGDLFIRGQGDPSMVLERLWLLLRRLQAQGVRSIGGDIVLDRSAFSLPAHDPAAFDGEPSKPYNAAPDALLVNFRALTLGFVPEPSSGRARVMVDPPLAGLKVPDTVPLAPARTVCGDWRGQLQADLSSPDRIAFAGSYPADCGEKSWPVAYADPDRYAARAIEGMWRSMGGRLAGRVREGRAPAGFAPAFSAASPTLAEVVRDINKYSNNVMAQQLFLTLSLQAGGTASFDASRAVVQRWWRERFPDVEAPVMDNGAGLSREGRVSAMGLTRLLQAAWRSPLMPDLAASLPISGIDGTLRRSQAGAGAAHLKTGSLRDVAAVAGYVHTASGRRWVLVAVANHPDAAAARPAFDALVAWAARQP